MTLANKLTCLRMILVVPFLIFASLRYCFSGIYSLPFMIIAVIIFVFACITDYFDGKIARATNTVTDFGKLLDPLADKLLTFSLLFVLVRYNRISILLVCIMLAREFIVTYERIYLTKQGYGVMPASIYGKIKTVVTMITLVIIMILPAIKILYSILILPSCILTVLSGVDYHIKADKMLRGGSNE